MRRLPEYDPEDSRWIDGNTLVWRANREEDDEQRGIEKYRARRRIVWGEDKPIDFAPKRKSISRSAQDLLNKPLPANPRGGSRLGPRNKS